MDDTLWNSLERFAEALERVYPHTGHSFSVRERAVFEQVLERFEDAFVLHDLAEQLDHADGVIWCPQFPEPPPGHTATTGQPLEEIAPELCRVIREATAPSQRSGCGPCEILVGWGKYSAMPCGKPGRRRHGVGVFVCPRHDD